MSDLKIRDSDIIENWYIACLSHELKKTPLARTIYDEAIVLFRDQNGKAQVLQDRCLHRGTKLSLGDCSRGSLTCPYHGWSFNGEGVVVSVPSEGNDNEEKLKTRAQAKNWQVPAYPCHEIDGAIWVYMGKKTTTPNPPTWRFPKSEDKNWVSYFMITDFPNEVNHLAQNFMDVPHTVYVHKKWFREKRMIEVPYDLEIGNGRVKATYQNPSDEIGGIMKKLINPENRKMEHTDEYIFPNLTRVDYMFGEHGFIINSQCTPITAYSCRVYTWIAYRGNFIAPLLKPLFSFYTRKVITQDVEIMQNQGSNLQRFPDKTNWVSTAADEIHLAIDHMREQGAKGTLDLKAAIQKKARTFWI